MDDVTKLTGARVANLLQEQGYRGKLDKFEDRVIVRSSSDGKGFSCFLHDATPDENAEVSSLQLCSTWALDGRELSAIIVSCNVFNQSYRYCKAHADSFGITLEADLFVPEGVSDNALGRFFDMWRRLMRVFEDHIGRLA